MAKTAAQLSREAEELIAKEEAFSPHAYQDSLGYWTIGYGILIDARRGGGITEAEARLLLRNRLEKIEEALDEKITWWRSLNDARQAVLVSMAYQMGVSGLLKFKNTLAAVKAGDYARAARGMVSSKWGREQSPARAKRHAEVMESGHYVEFYGENCP